MDQRHNVAAYCVMREIELLDPELIVVPATRRPLRESGVVALMESIKQIGQQIPIAVRDEGGARVLIAGRHRVEACLRLDMPVNAALFTDAREAEIWEIDENLKRVDLTKSERDAELAKRAALLRLTGEGEISPSNLAKSPPKSHKSTGVGRGVGAGRPKGAITRAAEEAGVSRETVRLAVRAAEGVAPEPRQAPSKLDLAKRAYLSLSEDDRALFRAWLVTK